MAKPKKIPQKVFDATEQIGAITSVSTLNPEQKIQAVVFALGTLAQMFGATDASIIRMYTEVRASLSNSDLSNPDL